MDFIELILISSTSRYLFALTQYMVYPLRRSIQKPASCQLVQRNIPRNAQFIHAGRSGLSIFVRMINLNHGRIFSSFNLDEGIDAVSGSGNVTSH